MDILENNVIGSFIFGLGRQVEARHGRMPCEPIGVELLQQTPLDTSLGDVLIANAKIVRLIEFKRESNRDAKEIANFQLLCRALNSSHLSHLDAISRKIHWFVQTNFSKTQNSIVVPYLDLKTPSSSLNLAGFIEKLPKILEVLA